MGSKDTFYLQYSPESSTEVKNKWSSTSITAMPSWQGQQVQLISVAFKNKFAADFHKSSS
jgi:hypothetical protein